MIACLLVIVKDGRLELLVGFSLAQRFCHEMLSRGQRDIKPRKASSQHRGAIHVMSIELWSGSSNEVGLDIRHFR
jgi:hypothetical protein